MWDCLVAFSTCIEDNSGQIQILIAFGAIYLAYKGYVKVLEQIYISTKQEKRANEQRNFELKIQSLNLSLMALDRNAAKINNLKELLDLSKQSIESINSESDVTEEDIQGLMNLINSKIEHAEDVQIDIFELCSNINNEDVIHDLDDLESIYETLILIINDQNNTDLMRHHFIKTED